MQPKNGWKATQRLQPVVTISTHLAALWFDWLPGLVDKITPGELIFVHFVVQGFTGDT